MELQIKYNRLIVLPEGRKSVLSPDHKQSMGTTIRESKDGIEQPFPLSITFARLDGNVIVLRDELRTHALHVR